MFVIPHSLPECLTLVPGAETTLRLPEGAVLHVSSGRLRMTPPMQWLGERCVAAAVELRQGEVMVVPARGMWSLSAEGEVVQLHVRTHGHTAGTMHGS